MTGKQGRDPLTEEKKEWLRFAGFAGGALALSAALTGLSALDRAGEIPYLWSLLTKVGILLLLALIISLSGTQAKLVEGRYLTRDVLWMAFPLLLTVAMSYGPFNTRPGILVGGMLFLNTLATVLWEELYFRFFSRLLFERKGVYHVRWVILTAFMYGASRLPAVFVSPFGGILLKSVLAASEGVFLLALYAKSRSIVLPMLSHFLTSFIYTFFHACSTGAEGVFGAGGVFLALLTVVYSATGFWLLFSSRRIAERKKKAGQQVPASAPPCTGTTESRCPEPQDGAIPAADRKP